MRIIHVAPFYHPVIGGVEDVVKHIAEHMAGRGHEVYVVTYNRLRVGGIGSLPREEAINGVRVIRLRPGITWSHGTYSPELPEVIKALKPDIVHVHVWRHPHVFQVAKLKRQLRFKAILHGHMPFYPIFKVGPVTWGYYQLVDTFFNNTLKYYDEYIALIPLEKYIVINKLHVDGDKVAIIPNGIEYVPKTDVDKNQDQILYLGRISKDKNVSLLIKSMIYLKGKARLVLAGPDEGILRSLYQFAVRHNIKTSYLGVVSDEEKYKLYLSSRIFAFPSKYDAMPVTLLEVASTGTPSVITGWGGQIYTAPPGRASLWAPPKPKEYAEAILSLIIDEDFYKKLSSKAKEWAQYFLWGKILPMYERLYAY